LNEKKKKKRVGESKSERKGTSSTIGGGGRGVFWKGKEGWSTSITARRVLLYHKDRRRKKRRGKRGRKGNSSWIAYSKKTVLRGKKISSPNRGRLSILLRKGRKGGEGESEGMKRPVSASALGKKKAVPSGHRTRGGEEEKVNQSGGVYRKEAGGRGNRPLERHGYTSLRFIERKKKRYLPESRLLTRGNSAPRFGRKGAGGTRPYSSKILCDKG